MKISNLKKIKGFLTEDTEYILCEQTCVSNRKIYGGEKNW